MSLFFHKFNMNFNMQSLIQHGEEHFEKIQEDCTDFAFDCLQFRMPCFEWCHQMCLELVSCTQGVGADVLNLIFERLKNSFKVSDESWPKKKIVKEKISRGRICQKTTNVACKQCCLASPCPRHLNQQLYHKSDTVSKCATSLRVCVCECERKK